MSQIGDSLDRKHKFLAVNNSNGKSYNDTEGIIFLAKDDCVPNMIRFYIEELERLGAKENQIMGAELMLDRVLKWRQHNPDQCKLPDVNPGEEEDLVLKPNY